MPNMVNVNIIRCWWIEPIYMVDGSPVVHDMYFKVHAILQNIAAMLMVLMTEVGQVSVLDVTDLQNTSYILYNDRVKHKVHVIDAILVIMIILQLHSIKYIY